MESLSEGLQFAENLSDLMSFGDVCTPPFPGSFSKAPLVTDSHSQVPYSDSDSQNLFADYKSDSDKSLGQLVVTDEMKIFGETLTANDVNEILAPSIPGPSSKDSKVVPVAPMLKQTKDLIFPKDEDQICLDEWAGPLNFKVKPSCPNPLRGGGKTFFSQELNKLYCDHVCPVEIEIHFDYAKVSEEDITHFSLQVCLVFEDPKLMNKAVLTCSRHSQTEMSVIETANQAQQQRLLHVLRSMEVGASHPIYYQNPLTKRCYVVNRMSALSAGTLSIKRKYKFVCLNSCLSSSGSSAPAISGIFCLFDKRGELVGRSILKLRVCSAPKRDYNADKMGNKRKSEELESGTSPVANVVRSGVENNVNRRLPQAGRVRNTVVARRESDEEVSSSQETIYSEYGTPKRICLGKVLKMTRKTLKLKYSGDPIQNMLVNHTTKVLLMLDDLNQQVRNYLMQRQSAGHGLEAGRSPDGGYHEDGNLPEDRE